MFPQQAGNLSVLTAMSKVAHTYAYQAPSRGIIMVHDRKITLEPPVASYLGYYDGLTSIRTATNHSCLYDRRGEPITHVCVCPRSLWTFSVAKPTIRGMVPSINGVGSVVSRVVVPI